MNKSTHHRANLLLVAFWLVIFVATAEGADPDPDLKLQIDRLRHPLPEARRDAVIAIADYGFHGEAAIEPLMRTLEDVDVDVRRAAVVSLAVVGAQSESAVLRLVEAMADPDWIVRRQAAESFSTVRGEVAVDALRTQLKSGSDDTRLAAAIAVSNLGDVAASAIPELVEMLGARDWKLRGAAARAIGSMGPQAGRPGIDGLAAALRDRDWAVAEPVVEALARVGSAAVPALIDALSDPAIPVRWGAARALGRIGSSASDAVHALASALDDPVMQVRWAAARALLGMGPAAASSGEALAAALQDDAWVVRWSAARALGSTVSGDSVDQGVAALAEALTDPDSRVCEAAAFALEEIGPRANMAIPALRRASTHGRESSENCQVIDAGPAAEEILIDDGWTVRWASVRALGVVGRDDPQILDALAQASEDEIWQVRGVATLALGQYDGYHFPAVVDIISEHLDDDSLAVRRAAVTALGSAGGLGARERLLTAAEDPEETVRAAAIAALEMLGGE